VVLCVIARSFATKQSEKGMRLLRFARNDRERRKGRDDRKRRAQSDNLH